MTLRIGLTRFLPLFLLLLLILQHLQEQLPILDELAGEPQASQANIHSKIFVIFESTYLRASHGILAQVFYTYQNLSASERYVGAATRLFREHHPVAALAGETEQTSRVKRQQRARSQRWSSTSRELGLEGFAPPTSQTGQDRVFPPSLFSPLLGHWIELNGLIHSSPSLWSAVQCGFGDDPMKPKTRSTSLYSTYSDATENPYKVIQL